MQRHPMRVVVGFLVALLVILFFQRIRVHASAESSGGHLLLGNPSGAVSDPAFPANYLIERPQYALSYARDAGIANWVSWHLEAGDLGSAPRGDFHTDTTLPAGWYQVTTSDYTNSGYDRGHMVPSADRTLTTDDNYATFYMTNVLPQHPDNNQGPWVGLETFSRSLVQGGQELYITSGGSGSLGTLANGKINIPAYVWKVIVVLPFGTNDLDRITTQTRTIAVWMPNTAGIRFTDWRDYVVTVDSIEAATGYDFWANVPDPIEAVIESSIDNGGDPTPTATPMTLDSAQYLPLMLKPQPTPTPTPVVISCSAPMSTTVPNSPIAIIDIDKGAETVTIQNVSTQTIDLTGWWICSDRGDQLHAILSGGLAPGVQLVVLSQAGGPIWSNAEIDPAGLYNMQGVQIGYRSE